MSKNFILNIEINNNAFKNIRDIIESCNGKIGSVVTDPNHLRSRIMAYFNSQPHQLFCKYLLLQREKQVQDLEKVYADEKEKLDTASEEKKKE